MLIKLFISEAEKKTNSELIPFIVFQSDKYPAAHFRAAIICSFIFSLVLYFSPLSIINPIYFLWIQLPGLFFGYWIGHIPLIKRLLITNEEIEQEVSQRGYEAFFQHNLHLTKNHNGVLILVSFMERKIKIICDSGISSKVDQKVWDDIVYQYTYQIKKGEFIAGLAKTIDAVSNVLETYFPNGGNNFKSNELADDLIVENSKK